MLETERPATTPKAATTSVKAAETDSSLPTPPAINCPLPVYEAPVCKCPESTVTEGRQLSPPASDDITVSIGITIGIGIGMFLLGGLLVGLLWLVYVKTDPTQRLKPVAISEDGISSSQESGHAATQRLMGNSREITACSLQS